MKNPITREELFILVWNQPVTEASKSLGVSDAALGKLCRRLQVPKPPQGYWAKIQAGKLHRKPPLPAFREQIDKVLGASNRRSSFIHLTNGQLELLNKALEILSEQGIETAEIQLVHDGIKTVSGDLAAQLLILIQHQHETWFKKSLMSSHSCKGSGSG
jgi:hypothetical protein